MRGHSKPGVTKSCTGIFHVLTISFVLGKIWKRKSFFEQYLSALNIACNCIFWKRPVAPETTREKNLFFTNSGFKFFYFLFEHLLT